MIASERLIESVDTKNSLLKNFTT